MSTIASNDFPRPAQAKGSTAGTDLNPVIALVHDGTATPLMPAIERGVTQALRGTDFLLVPRLLDKVPEAQLAGFIHRSKPAGVLIAPPLCENPRIASLCQTAGLRYVRLGTLVDGDAQCIAADDRAAMADTVRALVNAGHTRIGLITGPEDLREARERALGYYDAMAEFALDRGPALVANGDNTLDSGLEAGRLLLEVSPRPTAIIACNDLMAAGVLRAAAEKQVSVPADLSVIGFDDTPLAEQLTPALSSVQVPWAQMAREAAAWLVIRGPAPFAPPQFVPRLNGRGSAAPVNG